MHLDERILFVHNPRTSGTSIRRALLFGKDPNKELQFPANMPDLGKHAFPCQIRARLEGSQFVPHGLWDRVTKFSIVRNPWERLVSLYGLFRRPLDPRFQVRGTAKYPIKVDKLCHAIDPNFQMLEKAKQDRIEFCHGALQLSFPEWIKWCDMFGWQACPYLGIRPMTRIPQSRWFEGLDVVLPFEDRIAINNFLQDHGYDIPKVENVTRHDDWRSYYDGETRDLVANAFREDIDRFGY